MSDKNDNEGKSFVYYMVGIALLVVLLSGEPSIADSLRVKAAEWAGIDAEAEQ